MTRIKILSAKGDVLVTGELVGSALELQQAINRGTAQFVVDDGKAAPAAPKPTTIGEQGRVGGQPKPVAR